MTPRAGQTQKRTRIQEKNKERILAAALDVFAAQGFKGSTIDQIAEGANMSKPNLLYYFHGKKDIYVTMTWSEGLTVWNIAVGKPELFMLDDPAPKSNLGGPASAIVINLTTALSGLRF